MCREEDAELVPDSEDEYEGGLQQNSSSSQAAAPCSAAENSSARYSLRFFKLEPLFPKFCM